MTGPDPSSCLFCSIIAGDADAAIVYEDEHSIAFLDIRPVFPGHTLLVPREHHETLPDLPAQLVPPLFGAAQLLAEGVRDALDAAGTFVAINNKVSQSVPHLHVHIVPRRFKDGLRGFFWPRQKYPEGAMETTAAAIREQLARPVSP